MKITLTLKRSNGIVETIDITNKIGSCEKSGFENRILPKIIEQNKKVGTEVISWTFDEDLSKIKDSRDSYDKHFEKMTAIMDGKKES